MLSKQAWASSFICVELQVTLIYKWLVMQAPALSRNLRQKSTRLHFRAMDHAKQLSLFNRSF